MGTRATKYKALSLWHRALSALRPYRYDAARYAGTFLAKPTSVHKPETECEAAPEVVYAFWGDRNELTPSRKKSLEVIRENIGVKFCFVTPDNLEDYILADHPLHEAFSHLSSVHKSDYLRCYFMHHYGGGYTDVKQQQNSWQQAFEELNNSDSYVMGYPETGVRGIAPTGGVLEKDLKRYWKNLLGNCAYICKPRTQFSSEWYNEMLARMDCFSKELKLHPGNAYGDNEGYPVPWSYIAGQIFHPLCLKHHTKTLKSKRLMPNFKNYR